MARYLLTYDLRGDRNYSKLYEELKKFNALKVLESTYCFRQYETNAFKLRRHFKKFIDEDDGLFITTLTTWADHETKHTPDDL